MRLTARTISGKYIEEIYSYKVMRTVDNHITIAFFHLVLYLKSNPILPRIYLYGSTTHCPWVGFGRGGVGNLPKKVSM